CPERSEASDAAPLVPFADAAAPWSSCRLIPSSRSLSAIFGSPGVCALQRGSLNTRPSRSDGTAQQRARRWKGAGTMDREPTDRSTVGDDRDLLDELTRLRDRLERAEARLAAIESPEGNPRTGAAPVPTTPDRPCTRSHPDPSPITDNRTVTDRRGMRPPRPSGPSPSAASTRSTPRPRPVRPD